MGPMLHTGHYGWIDVPVDPRHVAREQSLKQKLNARTQAYKLLVQKLDSARAETSVTEVPELSEVPVDDSCPKTRATPSPLDSPAKTE
ncbi:hypothetical protein CYMTET_56487 [Cymbomonas tetramitiformis]|uniref:Uncharacterized protein n=1 Tax=Cymbomonas tetramitiformis TaxID=36881 RepID=A0AAE0BB70_9CHLO|nr:hypothetical protein CYMTET_56487 [Cymbomonas tetramitiformis]